METRIKAILSASSVIAALIPAYFGVIQPTLNKPQLAISPVGSDIQGSAFYLSRFNSHPEDERSYSFLIANTGQAAAKSIEVRIDAAPKVPRWFDIESIEVSSGSSSMDKQFNYATIQIPVLFPNEEAKVTINGRIDWSLYDQTESEAKLEFVSSYEGSEKDYEDYSILPRD